MAGRTALDELWQANITITKKKKKKSFVLLIENDQIILLMKHNYNDNDNFFKEDKRVSDNVS